MEDALIDDDHLPPARRSILPGEGFFVPDSVDETRAEAEAEARLAGADVVVVADPDADGLACVALVRHVHDEAALLGIGPHELGDGLERAAEFVETGATVYVCDLCPDDRREIEKPLTDLVDRAGAVRWFDHHRWDQETETAVRDLDVELVIGESEEECTADVALRALDGDFPAYLEELVAATRDHDLWIREDPRSEDLADYSYWADPEEYAETVREHGADLPPTVEELLTERRREKEDLIERAVGRAELRSVGPLTIGITYGRCSQNEVAEALRLEGADAAVVVKPSGSASIRGTETFERCHEVARQVGGGGHPRAAGCKPDVYEDMLDYAHHWTTRGAVTKQVILDAFRALDLDERAEDDASA